MTGRPDRTGVVLAGGASRRMGLDKAFVEVDGRPMVLRVADALRDGGCTSIECQGGDAERLGRLGLPAHDDARPGQGPVPAIVQALGRHDGTVVIAACDLPDLDGTTIDAVADVVDRGAPAAVATSDGRHLVLAVRARPEFAPNLERADVATYRGMLAAIGAVDVPVDAAAIRNVNRPDDLG